MANGYIGLVNIGTDFHKIGSTAFAVLNHNVNGTVTKSATQVDFVVPLDGYVNTEGATVHIKFVQANDVNDMPLYLKVGGDNPHLIVNPNGTKTWAENSVISFTYDGTNWVMNSSQISVDASQLDIPGFGNITKEGKLSNAAAAAATGDALVIVDTNDNAGRIAKSSILFDTTKNDYFLTQAGGWTQLNKSVWGLDNVTNHQQVHEVAWDSTNKKITRSKNGTANDVVQFIQGSNITLTSEAGKLTIAGTANNAVTQTNTTGDATYNLLFSYSTSTTDTKTEGVRKHSTLTYNPSTGTLTATKFSGDGSGLTNVTASSIQWSAIDNKPTTISGYGITDAKINNGVITLGSNTIKPITKVNGKSAGNDSSVTITAGDLGLAAALRFVGTTTSNDIQDGWQGVPAGISGYTTPIVGDVVLKGDAEYVCISVTGTGSNTVYTWELLGRDGSFALSTEVINKSVFNAAYQLLYSTGASSPAVLDPNTTSTRKFLRMVGNGTVGAAPEWDTVTKTDVGLSNVENTKLSTWTGSSYITTVGTITSGTWHGTAIEASYIGSHSTDKLTSGTLPIARGGTNISTYTKGDILYASAANTLSKLSVGTNSDGYVLTLDSGVPAWKANQATDENVKQSPIAQNSTDANKEYAILFKNTHSAWTEETAGVKFTSTNDYRITINPSTGTLTAKNLVGALRAVDVKTALGYVSGTANSSIIFLHKSGNWKTISVGVGTTNENGNVLTNVTQSAGTKPKFTQGTLASASVSGGILTLVSATADTFSAGAFPTLTLTKANVTISAADT